MYELSRCIFFDGLGPGLRHEPSNGCRCDTQGCGDEPRAIEADRIENALAEYRPESYASEQGQREITKCFPSTLVGGEVVYRAGGADIEHRLSGPREQA